MIKEQPNIYSIRKCKIRQLIHRFFFHHSLKIKDVNGAGKMNEKIRNMKNFKSLFFRNIFALLLHSIIFSEMSSFS